MAGHISIRAIILGGSRGIGFAVAQKFLKHGIDVTLVSKNENNLRSSLDRLRQCSNIDRADSPIPAVDYSVCDIASENQIIDCCRRLLDDAKSIDILINSAGIVQNKLLVSSAAESMRHLLDTNLLGTMLFTRTIVKKMLRQKRGTVINIGSVIGSKGNIGQTVYSASKAGLEGFTKSLAKELGPKGITANLIAPGFIETDMTTTSGGGGNGTMNEKNRIEQITRTIPLQRIGTAQEVANVAYFLASSSYISGEVFTIDGGLSLTF